MWSSILLFRSLLRLRWHTAIVLLSMVVVLLMILSVIASTNTVSSYVTVKSTSRLPAHTVLTLELYNLRYGGLEPLRKLDYLMTSNVTGLLKSRVEELDSVSVMKVFTLQPNATLAPSGEAIPRPTSPPRPGVGVEVTVVYPTIEVPGLQIATFHGKPVGLRLGDGILWVERRFYDLAGKVPELKGYLELVIKSMGLDMNSISFYECPGALPLLEYGCPHVVVDEGYLSNLIGELEGTLRVSRVAYVYYFNYSTSYITLLSPDTVPDLDSKLTREYATSVNLVLGSSVLHVNHTIARGSVTVSMGEVSLNGLSSGVSFSYTSMLSLVAFEIGVISTFTSGFILAISLPVLVTAIILVRSLGESVAYDVRRSLLLSYVRGVSPRSFTFSFIIYALTLGLVAVALSQPMLKLLVELSSNVLLGSVYYSVPLPDLGYLISGLAVTLIVLFLVIRRVRGLIARYSDLTQASRVYLPLEYAMWKPSVMLTILFLLSVFKYILWVTGYDVGDIIRWASRVHPLLLVPLIFYAILDFFISFIAPIVVPYYLVLLLLSSRRVIDVYTRIASTILRGGLSSMVFNMVLRVTPRIGSLAFSLSLILLFSTAAGMVRSSFNTWYNRNMSILEAGSGDFGLMFASVVSNAILFYTTMGLVFMGSLALIASAMLAYTVYKVVEVELVVLKARGVSRLDTLRLAYGPVLVVTLIALTVAPLGLVVARGFTESFNSIFLGRLERLGLGVLQLSIDPVSLMIPLAAILVSLVTPVILVVLLDTRTTWRVLRGLM